MTWMRFSQGYRLDPVTVGSPEVLVVLLHDLDAPAGMLLPVAARWATAVPTTTFLALDAIDPTSWNIRTQPTKDLEARLEHQLRLSRFTSSRLVVVGFGYAGTLALRMVLHQGWYCAGVLAFVAKLMRPLPPALRVANKLRLIQCAGDVAHSSLRGDVELLTARGIDTRGVLLSGSALSQEAVRHGCAYLVELVATAQRGDRFKDGRIAHSSPGGKRLRERDAGWQP